MSEALICSNVRGRRRQKITAAILQLAKIDVNKKWTRPVLTAEPEIFLELMCRRPRELALRLPFPKTCPQGTPKHRWLPFLYGKLRRTVQSQEWFEEAHDENVRQGTNLGTLKYLPPEIREQIWKELLMPKGFPEVLFVDFPHSGPLRFQSSVDLKPLLESYHKIYAYVVGRLRHVFGRSAHELDAVFYRIHIFKFVKPEHFTRFIDLIGPEPIPFLRIEIKVFAYCDCCWLRFVGEMPDNVCLEEWSPAFDRSLPCLKSVDFDTRCACFGWEKIYRTPTERTSTDYERLRRAISKSSPRAKQETRSTVTTVEIGSLSASEREAYMKALIERAKVLNVHASTCRKNNHSARC